MHQWIETFVKGDLRHILKKYDKNVSILELRPFFDELMREDEALSGSDSYSNHLEKIEDRLYKELQIVALKLLIKCIEFGAINEAKRVIELFAFNIKINDKILIDKDAIKNVERRIKQIFVSIELNKQQEEEEKVKEKKVTWESLMVKIHKGLGINIKYNCTVSLYRAYEKELAAYNKEKTKQNG